MITITIRLIVNSLVCWIIIGTTWATLLTTIMKIQIIVINMFININKLVCINEISETIALTLTIWISRITMTTRTILFILIIALL